MADESQPGGAGCSRIIGAIVRGRDATYYIFIYIDAKAIRDLLGDSNTTEAMIPAIHLDDELDDVQGRSFWAWFTAVGR